jgi:NhaP-type Na+/H+ or K+/H+ antiporter
MSYTLGRPVRIVGVPAPETNPRDRPLGYMMPDFTIALAIGVVIGFILGYGVRAIISYRRHRHARRQSYFEN